MIIVKLLSLRRESSTSFVLLCDIHDVFRIHLNVDDQTNKMYEMYKFFVLHLHKMKMKEKKKEVPVYLYTFLMDC